MSSPLCLRLKPDWGEAYGQLALAASGNKDYAACHQALGCAKEVPARTPEQLLSACDLLRSPPPVCPSRGELQGFSGGVQRAVSRRRMEGATPLDCDRARGQQKEMKALHGLLIALLLATSFAAAAGEPCGGSATAGRCSERNGLCPPQYAGGAAGSLEDANHYFGAGDVKAAHAAIDLSLHYARRSVDCSLQLHKGEKSRRDRSSQPHPADEGCYANA